MGRENPAVDERRQLLDSRGTTPDAPDASSALTERRSTTSWVPPGSQIDLLMSQRAAMAKHIYIES